MINIIYYYYYSLVLPESTIGMIPKINYEEKNPRMHKRRGTLLFPPGEDAMFLVFFPV